MVSKWQSWNAFVLVIFFAILPVLFFSGAANASTTFNFSFDNTTDGGVVPPLVGSGTLSFDESLGSGTYALNTLTNLAFSVSFTDGKTFVLADAEDPLSEVLAVITTIGSDLFLLFGNINGVSSGTINGSIDFINASGFLSFAPGSPGLAGMNIYVERSGVSPILGNYEAVGNSSVPEPATMLLLGLALIGLAGIRRKDNN